MMLIFVVSSCEKQPSFKIFENKVIECCDVSIPTENLAWLKKIIDESPSYSVLSLKLFVNNKDNSQYIVKKDAIFTSVYDCAGNQLFVGAYSGDMGSINENNKTQRVSPVPCEECEEFFKTHHLVGILYEKMLNN